MTFAFLRIVNMTAIPKKHLQLHDWGLHKQVWSRKATLSSMGIVHKRDESMILLRKSQICRGVNTCCKNQESVYNCVQSLNYVQLLWTKASQWAATKCCTKKQRIDNDRLGYLGITTMRGLLLYAVHSEVEVQHAIWLAYGNLAKHLTLTLDGWSDARMESVYSCTIIFPNWRTILLKSEDLSSTTHSGKTIAGADQSNVIVASLALHESGRCCWHWNPCAELVGDGAMLCCSGDRQC